MVDIKVQSLISFLDVTICKDSILSVKKGFGNYITESLFALIDDIKTFVKSGLYRDVKGFIVINGQKSVISYENAKESLEKAVKSITEMINDRFIVKTQNYEIYFASKDYDKETPSLKTLPLVLKYLTKVKFDEFKIYTNCGVLYTYHDMIGLDVDIFHRLSE